MIVRPDYYIFGATTSLAGLGAVVDALARKGATYGLGREPHALRAQA
jgi:hypothetical protein